MASAAQLAWKRQMEGDALCQAALPGARGLPRPDQGRSRLLSARGGGAASGSAAAE
eukprot:CAMPEP_0175378424 /NCGR_PEP_ID=MMETSP0095-20121207/25292_1 /TAXON_ID=311494 /ORGANISM="Alexandrium monilatum, Strain CCMP3105" /LENGTH=55 /DNA_ID=CAMNT_0016676755 /DNA_START=46 /DNA_END=210 /DNA_ORIENTATION=-